MKNQLVIGCFICVLVFIAGCSQPDPQRLGGTAVKYPTVTTQTHPVPVEGENIGTETQPNDNVQFQVKIDQTLITGSAVAPDSVDDAQGRMLHREMNASNQMMPEMAMSPSYDYGGMPYFMPTTLDLENYTHFDDNTVKRVSEQSVSTFSIDVDTGSYSLVRRILNSGQLPRHDAVRSEELINYFSYDYPVPAGRSTPFAVFKQIAPTPWNSDTHLLHIGIKGFDHDRANLPAANLVFLVDVSGSMQGANKLELLKTSLKMLTRQLRKQDTVSIVVYAGASGVVLEPTSGDNKAKIVAALDRLQAGGSTNGAAGIELAYAIAEQAYVKEGINRVLLATDGDFNVGTVDLEQLKNLVEKKRKSGIALSTLGFGSGNYNDALMEQIADIGNGNYAYIDTLNEARKVLIEEMSSTMLTIARDVKIQIEFNPAVVSEYRLIGYENRVLNREDFNNDKVDAGDIGAGHTVTAIYEVVLVGGAGNKIDPLRYQSESTAQINTSELAFLRLRYKDPEADSSQLLEWVIARDEIIADINNTSTEFRYSAAVAAFAQMLRGGQHLEKFTWQDIVKLAQSSRGEDPFGYRGEFISLIQLADSLSSTTQTDAGQVGLVQ
jgi:Ca-activated chloride channel family protein